MRIRSACVVVAAGLGLAAGVAGCQDTGGPTGAGSTGPTGSPGASATGSPTGGPAPAGATCPAGSWQTVGLDGKITGGGAAGTATGGGGVRVMIDRGGATRVEFTGMAPVAVSGTAAGTEVRGTLVYGGVLTGTLQLPSGAVSSGRWAPAGPVDAGNVTVTVDLSAPVQARLADAVPVSRFTGDQVIGFDPQPLLREGTFVCAGDTLRLTVTGQPVTGTWTLRRA